MSEPLIRAALEARLAAMSPAIVIAYENVNYVPVVNTPYARINLMRAQPANPEAGKFQQAQGIFQVTLEYPQNVGPGVVEARAKAIADWFPRALSLSASGIVVTIMRAAYIMAGFADGDRWAVPVRVFYQANIS
jgi:hypothetical protein